MATRLYGFPVTGVSTTFRHNSNTCSVAHSVSWHGEVSLKEKQVKHIHIWNIHGEVSLKEKQVKHIHIWNIHGEVSLKEKQVKHIHIWNIHGEPEKG